MTTTAVETPENLVVAYQQTGNNSIFSSIYDFVHSNSGQAYSILREILPESKQDSGTLGAIVDASLLQSLKSYNNADNSVHFLAHFLETVRKSAEAIKRAYGMKVASISEIYFYAVANSLPESTTDLWEQQWNMPADDLVEFKDKVIAVKKAFDSYSNSGEQHKHWAQLLAWESTSFLEYGSCAPTDAQELQHAKDSFFAYFANLQRQKSAAEQLHQLARQYQLEGGAQLFNAIYENAAIVEVAEEYRSYMADPESYCSGQAVIHSDFIEMIIENALEAAIEELPEGAELPAEFGSYAIAEFEYFIAMSERETESTAS